MAKKSSFQQNICEFLRYLSFALCIFTLLTFISFVWFDWPNKDIVYKALFSTGAVFATSILTMLIFMDWEDEFSDINKVKSESDFES